MPFDQRTSRATSRFLRPRRLTRERHHIGRAAQEDFIRDLVGRLHDMKKELSSAVGMWVPKVILPVIDQFDFLNVMSDDHNEPGESPVPVQTASIPEAQMELEWWVSHGARREKLVLGVPFFGFKWVSGVKGGNAVPYRQIVEDFGGVPTNDEISIGMSTITLNSSETIRTKAELAKADYGGVMAWELWQDATGERSLLRVVKDVMR